MDRDHIWQVEEDLWRKGEDAFRDMVDPGCLMAFPGLGVIGKDAAIAGLKDAPRWSEIALQDRHLSRIGKDLVVLGYKAAARRAGEAPYCCFATSTYRRTADGWQLMQHQQTPADCAGADL